MTKPQYLYHGSTTPNIKILEPRKRYMPEAMKDISDAIYAGDIPAYAAAHAFPWGSEEGFDIDFEKGKVVLKVPANQVYRLEQPIVIYKVSAESFKLLEKVEPLGHNYASFESVNIISSEKFSSVKEAMEKLGGEIRIIN